MVNSTNAVGQRCSSLADMVEQTLRFNGLQHSESSSCRHGVPAECGAVLSGLEQISRCADSDTCTQRQAPAEALCQSDDVRLNSGVLESEPGSSPADSGLNFVEQDRKSVV